MISSRPAATGLWLDCDYPLTPPRIAAMLAWADPRGRKVVGVFRYVPLPGNSAAGDISAQELLDLTDAGLMVGWVQHVLMPGWLPYEHLGAIHEAHSSQYALDVGFPADMHGGFDIEGCTGHSYGYALTWASNRVQRGGHCLGYHGYELGMTPEQFAAMPNVTSYWRAAGQPALPGGRGDAVIQHYPPVTIPGVGEVDLDDVQVDGRGDLPMVAARV